MHTPMLSPTKGPVSNYGKGGGGYKMGKSRVKISCAPPLRQCKKFCAPHLLKGGNFLPLPFSMAKTFSATPFHRGKTSRAPLPVIKDQSLIAVGGRPRLQDK